MTCAIQSGAASTTGGVPQAEIFDASLERYELDKGVLSDAVDTHGQYLPCWSVLEDIDWEKWQRVLVRSGKIGIDVLRTQALRFRRSKS